MPFIFKHSTDALLPFLQETAQHIKNNLPEGIGEIMMHKSKFVLTELCTNGIKHAGVPQSSFEITVDAGYLTILRKDNGVPFNLEPKQKEQQLLKSETRSDVTLAEDDINRLIMQRINNQTVCFFVEEVPALGKKANPTLVEHFGFIIICRSCSSFTYSRLPSGENVFSVSIPLT